MLFTFNLIPKNDCCKVSTNNFAICLLCCITVSNRVALTDADPALLEVALTQSVPELLSTALVDIDPELLKIALTKSKPELLATALTVSNPAILKVSKILEKFFFSLI